MKFSVIHPTARVKPTGSFPQGWLGACQQWEKTCENPSDVEYIVVVHESRLSDFWNFFTAKIRIGVNWPKWGRFTVVVNHLRDCVVDQCNEGMKAASGELIIGAMDDLFAPQGWDAKLSALCPDTSKPISLHCLTGSARDNEIFNPACCTKVLFDLMGPISPEYESMFVDNEYTLQFHRLGKVVETGLMFEHRHPIFGTADEDEVYALQNRPEAYEIGRKVFEGRKLRGFPRVSLPGFPEVKQEAKLTFLQKASNGLDRLLNPAPMPLPRRTVAVCLPNKNYDWLASIFNVQGAFAAAGFDFAAILGYSSTADATRIGLARSVLDSFSRNRSTPYVLWIDDDNIIPPELIARWLAFFEDHSQADIITGWCWIQRGKQWTPSVGVFKDPEPICTWFTLQDIFQGGPEIRKVDSLASGFPCVMMRREVLEQLGPKAFRRIPCEKEDPGLVGEDFSFMWRVKEKGFNCYLDPMGKVGHLKLICQEPDILPSEALADPVLKQMREQVNGRPVFAPKEYRNVGA